MKRKPTSHKKCEREREIKMISTEEIQRLHTLCDAAFRAPWTASTWEVECEDEECCGNSHDCETIESPDEYPDGQVVAQVHDDGTIHTPGLSEFAKANAAFIAAARSALPQALDALEEARRESAAAYDFAAYWILRAREAVYRQGWEEGPSSKETSEGLTDALFNLGCDPGSERPEDIAYAKRLLKRPPSCHPSGDEMRTALSRAESQIAKLREVLSDTQMCITHALAIRGDAELEAAQIEIANVLRETEPTK